MFKHLHTILCILLIGLGCGSNTTEQEDLDTTIEPNDAELQLFIGDMTEPHDAKPSGVPAIGWDEEPRVGYGNNPPQGWNAMIPWGQVYTDELGNEADNVRFQIKNLQTWYLSKSEGKWIKWTKSSDLGGANYAEDFQNDTNIAADIEIESTNGGGISATLVPGFNFHFWTNDGRVTIDPDDISAVWSAVDARLILEDEQGTDERSEARLMMSVGADYWLNLDAQWDDWKTNGDIFIGRFRYMTAEWQRFHGHSLTMQQIQDGLLPPLKEE